MEKLFVSPVEKEKLWNDYRDNVNRPHEVDDNTFLDEDIFRLIADWHYLAVLYLSKVKGFNGKPEWIAKRLSIKKDEAEEALEPTGASRALRKLRSTYVLTKNH